MPKCKSCQQAIQFIQTENGKLMPVEIGVKKFITRDGILREGFEPHWIRCPHADKHRKKGRK